MLRCPPCLVIIIKGWLTYTTFEGTKISAIVISYFVNMHTHILLPVLGSIIWASQIFGHVIPRSVENMNGDYLISNPNLQSTNTFSTRFSDRPDVEYFDLYTPEISTRYDRYSNINFRLRRPTGVSSSDMPRFSGPWWTPYRWMPTSSIDLRTKQWQLWDMKQIRQLSTKFWHICKLKLVRGHT